MTAATVVGIYVRQGGVWERANAGTPEGFSGPQVRKGGSWQNVTSARTRVSGTWEYMWVNIDGELSVGQYSAMDFDISPYNLSAFVELNPDGSVDRKHNGTTTNGYSSWRGFDCGRAYEIKSDRTTPGGSFIVEEPLPDNTWQDLHDPDAVHRWDCAESGTGFSFINENWDIRVREAVSAPSSGNDQGDVDIDMDAEF